MTNETALRAAIPASPAVEFDEPQYTKHLSDIERDVIDDLIREALAQGALISVYDGEEWALSRSTDYRRITSEIAATDETTIGIRLRDDAMGWALRKVGTVFLVHGNGAEVVSDYTDVPEVARIVMMAEYLGWCRAQKLDARSTPQEQLEECVALGRGDLANDLRFFIDRWMESVEGVK